MVRWTCRARYSGGQIAGQAVPAYAEEDGVEPEHGTETFAEVHFELDNRRWAGTIFRLRTGKALRRDRKHVAVHFRPVHHLPFECQGQAQPNVLRFGLEPESVVLELTGTGPRIGTGNSALSIRAARRHPRTRCLVEGAGSDTRVRGRLRGTATATTGRIRRVGRRSDPMKTEKDAKSKGTILIADYDFGDVNIERAIIEGAGFQIVAAQCKSEDEVIEHGRDADGVLAQYAPIGARAINASPYLAHP
jgi:Glucose-6-phosphate dehydrogenase, C-terminal domain